MCFLPSPFPQTVPLIPLFPPSHLNNPGSGFCGENPAGSRGSLHGEPALNQHKHQHRVCVGGKGVPGDPVVLSWALAPNYCDLRTTVTECVRVCVRMCTCVYECVRGQAQGPVPQGLDVGAVLHRRPGRPADSTVAVDAVLTGTHTHTHTHTRTHTHTHTRTQKPQPL